MKYQKTILVAALMAAMGGVVHAQDWVEPSSYTDLTENKPLQNYEKNRFFEFGTMGLPDHYRRK